MCIRDRSRCFKQKILTSVWVFVIFFKMYPLSFNSLRVKIAFLPIPWLALSPGTNATPKAPVLFHLHVRVEYKSWYRHQSNSYGYILTARWFFSIYNIDLIFVKLHYTLVNNEIYRVLQKFIQNFNGILQSWFLTEANSLFV